MNAKEKERELVEPKQETLEEAAERIFPNHKGLTVLASNKIMLRRNAFIKGAKWHAERSHSDEEVYNILEMAMISCYTEELETHYSGDFKNLKEWFEQFKKENNTIINNQK